MLSSIVGYFGALLVFLGVLFLYAPIAVFFALAVAIGVATRAVHERRHD